MPFYKIGLLDIWLEIVSLTSVAQKTKIIRCVQGLSTYVYD